MHGARRYPRADRNAPIESCSSSLSPWGYTETEGTWVCGKRSPTESDCALPGVIFARPVLLTGELTSTGNTCDFRGRVRSFWIVLTFRPELRLGNYVKHCVNSISQSCCQLQFFQRTVHFVCDCPISRSANRWYSKRFIGE